MLCQSQKYFELFYYVHEFKLKLTLLLFKLLSLKYFCFKLFSCFAFVSDITSSIKMASKSHNFPTFTLIEGQLIIQEARRKVK